MSINLYFSTRSEKGNSAIIDFPFQTPSKLSLAVLKAKTDDEKIDLISEQLKTWEWEEEEISDCIGKIKNYLNDSALYLEAW